MRKFLVTIFQLIFVLGIAWAVFIPQEAHAIGFFGIEIIDNAVIDSILNWTSYQILGLVSVLVTAAGLFMSIAIQITLHIKELYESIDGIAATWRLVRDISSMLIIFFLLYYSILTILGKADSGDTRRLIVKIFLAGIFINFSLFFARVAIDASNLVSLQFYNAIAPATADLKNFSLMKAYNEGGLSNVFLQSLKVQKIYAAASAGGGLAAPGILFATVGGIILMLTAAFSLFAAAIAFSLRTAILVFVMAISPLYFAGMIFPQVKKQISDKIMDVFRGQLVFMPVYFFLLYIALRFISDPSFNNIFGQSIQANGQTSYALVWSGLIIQYVIAILFINIPLVAAITLSGTKGLGMTWAPKANTFASFFGRNTAGRFIGRPLGKVFDTMAASAQETALGRGTSSVLRALKVSQGVRGGLEKIEKSKYGGSYNLADVEKEDKERKKEVAAFARREAQKKVVKEFVGKEGYSIKEFDEFRKNVGDMDTKEFQEMKFEKLKDPIFAASIPANKFDSLVKELTPTEQKEIKDARKEGFKTILKEHKADYLLKDVLKNKPDAMAKLPDDVLKDMEVATRLSSAALKKMVDENVSDEVREEIRKAIITRHGVMSAAGTPIPPVLAKAYDYLEHTPGGKLF